MHLWSYRLVQNWFCNVTCSEEALGGSGAIVLLELVLTSRTSTVSACSSFASISALRVAAHVVLGFLHWRCLQLHPGNRITVNQSTCVRNKEEVLER